jgi:hypothetical protein
MVRMLEGQQLLQPACGSVTALDLAQAAWQCLLALVDLAAAGGTGWHNTQSAAEHLLCSAPAGKVLLQQPGGVCSLEEVCGVLVRCLQSDEDTTTVEAAVGLLGQPDRLEAALTVPGFATALIKHALVPSATNGLGASRSWEAKARLLEVLVSHVSGRAALMAEAGTLGPLAWKVATDEEANRICSPHLVQLWVAGAEEGLAKAMVAGLAACEEGWVRFFGWLVSRRSGGEWAQLDGLTDALIAAFGLHKPEGRMTPLEQVLLWLLEREGGQDLLWDCPEVEEAVSEWLQRTASLQRPSPLVPLLQSDTSGAAEGLAHLASSSVLAKGALLSLVTCRQDFVTYSNHEPLDRLIAGWVAEHEEVQQLVLEDRGLLCALLRAYAAAWSGAGAQQSVHRNISSARVLAEVPVEDLLPQLVELLVGVEDGNGSSLSATAAAAGGVARPTGALPELASVLSVCKSSSSSAPTAIPPPAAAGSPDVLLVAGAWLALEQFRQFVAGEQPVLEAMHKLACDAARVRELQQVEAAGHVACVAAAQARQQLVVQQQQLQREREALAMQQKRLDASNTAREQLLAALQQERELAAAEQQRLEQEKVDIAAQQQQLQQERQAMRTELQQLEQSRGETGRRRKQQKL